MFVVCGVSFWFPCLMVGNTTSTSTCTCMYTQHTDTHTHTYMYMYIRIHVHTNHTPTPPPTHTHTHTQVSVVAKQSPGPVLTSFSAPSGYDILFVHMAKLSMDVSQMYRFQPSCGSIVCFGSVVVGEKF